MSTDTNDVQDAMELDYEDWRRRNRPVAWHITTAIDTYETIEDLAGRKDLHGRPRYGHRAIGLRLDHQVSDYKERFDVYDGDHLVAQVRLERKGEHLVCSIATIDDSYDDDLRRLVERLPAGWVYERVG